jgi:hypothetical protein
MATARVHSWKLDAVGVLGGIVIVCETILPDMFNRSPQSTCFVLRASYFELVALLW